MVLVSRLRRWFDASSEATRRSALVAPGHTDALPCRPRPECGALLRPRQDMLHDPQADRGYAPGRLHRLAIPLCDVLLLRNRKRRPVGWPPLTPPARSARGRLDCHGACPSCAFRYAEPYHQQYLGATADGYRWHAASDVPFQKAAVILGSFSCARVSPCSRTLRRQLPGISNRGWSHRRH